MNDIAVISLTSGGFSVVDAEFFQILQSQVWRQNKIGGYVMRNSEKPLIGSRSRYLHRLVNGTPDGVLTDHKNSLTIDNRRINLRNSNRHQNGVNSHKRQSIYSQFKGVCLDKRRNKWQCHFTLPCGKRKWIGNFSTEKEAASAYNRAVIEFHGEFSYLNQVN